MKIILKIFILFVPFFVFSQSPDLKFKENEKYEKTLVYQGKEGDFLIFYESDPANIHQLYYLRYRLDRWDYDNDEVIVSLIHGQEYSVNFIFNKFEEKSDSTGFDIDQKKIRTKILVIYGKYLSHKQTQINKIRI